MLGASEAEGSHRVVSSLGLVAGLASCHLGNLALARTAAACARTATDLQSLLEQRFQVFSRIGAAEVAPLTPEPQTASQVWADTFEDSDSSGGPRWG